MSSSRTAKEQTAIKKEHYLSLALTPAKRKILNDDVLLEEWADTITEFLRLPKPSSRSGLSWQSNGNLRISWWAPSYDYISTELPRVYDYATSKLRYELFQFGIHDIYLSHPGPSTDAPHLLSSSSSLPLIDSAHPASRLTPPASPKSGSTISGPLSPILQRKRPAPTEPACFQVKRRKESPIEDSTPNPPSSQASERSHLPSPPQATVQLPATPTTPTTPTPISHSNGPPPQPPLAPKAQPTPSSPSPSPPLSPSSPMILPASAQPPSAFSLSPPEPSATPPPLPPVQSTQEVLNSWLKHLTTMIEKERCAAAELAVRLSKSEERARGLEAELQLERVVKEKLKLTLAAANAAREGAQAAHKSEREEWTRKEAENAEALQAVNAACAQAEDALARAQAALADERTRAGKQADEHARALQLAKDALRDARAEQEAERAEHAAAAALADAARLTLEGTLARSRTALQTAKTRLEAEWRERAALKTAHAAAMRCAEDARAAAQAAAAGAAAELAAEREKAAAERETAAARLAKARQDAQRAADAAALALADEEARCRRAERRVVAERRRAELADRGRAAAELRVADLERELARPELVPAVLDALREMSRMTAQVVQKA